MDREDPEKEEEGEGHPRTQCSLFHPHPKGPKGQEDEEKEDEPLKREWEVKMA
jgi:hypothetical protein